MCHAAKILPQTRPELDELAGDLASAFEANASDEWPWWEPVLVWGNGRLPEAMLRAAMALDRDDFGKCGMRSLTFLGEVTHERNRCVASRAPSARRSERRN